jgi:large subunit ribosomal protein L30e
MVGKIKSEGINSQLALVMKSGKTKLGYKSVISAIRSGSAKAIILSNNLSVLRKSQLEYLAVLAKVKTIAYNGNNSDLGTACGKLYRISCMCVADPGDSDILVEA